MQGLNRKIRARNVMLKLDIAKAYDQVNWSFLLQVLQRLGFSESWRNIIFNAISSPSFSVMLNGCTKSFFKASRGLRQGDPLSNFLFFIFILTKEILSCMLSHEFILGRVKPFHPVGGSVITHLLYADDILIFANGGKSSIRNLMVILRRYETLSGQLINPSKSSIFFSSSISVDNKNGVENDFRI